MILRAIVLAIALKTCIKATELAPYFLSEILK